MKNNIIEETVGTPKYDRLTSRIPEEAKPYIIRSENSTMPGYQQMEHLTEIGDSRVNDMLLRRGIDGGWDKNLIFSHYLKGLDLKHQLADKLGITDRTGFTDVALGYGMQNHYYIDEFGVSLTQELAFPAYITDACKKYLIRVFTKAIKKMKERGDYDGLDLDQYDRVVSSYPRGKNTGLPWIASGKNRFQNDIVLASNALLADLFVKGYSYQDVFKDMYVGYIVFSRYQRTGKIVPMNLDGKSCLSKHFEPRRRVVNGTPKAMAMAVKPLVKWLTNVSLETDVFSQDRTAITKRIKSASDTFASDASRFDLRSGGVKLKQGLQMIWDVATHFHKNIPTGVYKTMMDEAFLPTLASYGYPENRLYETHAAALRSGASTTSRVGSIINLMYDMMIEAARIGSTSPDEIANYYVRHEPSVILGDDLLKIIQPDNEKQFGGKATYADNMKVLDKVGMSVELEEPTKFLGYHINNKELYHGTSPLDNMFFPERFNTNPVSSLLMRYIILKHPKASNALDVMTNVMRNEGIAAKVYQDMIKDCYPILKEHYGDHPVGGARQFFSVIKENYSGAQVSKNIHSDLDSVLTFISKGSAYDFNYALIGLPELNDVVEDDTDVVKASLHDLITQSANVAKGHGIIGKNSARDNVSNGYNTDDLSNEKWISELKNNKQKNNFNDALKLFAQDKPDAIIASFHNILPRIARRITTTKGPVYIANL